MNEDPATAAVTLGRRQVEGQLRSLEDALRVLNQLASPADLAPPSAKAAGYDLLKLASEMMGV